MKHLFMILVTMLTLQNVAVAATSKLICERERYEFISVELEDWKSKGTLVDNFNGSDLVCGRNVSLVKDPNFVGDGICVGIWDSGFDQTMDHIDVIAKINISKTADGKITAVYEKNADLRGHPPIETVTLNCTIEN